MIVKFFVRVMVSVSVEPTQIGSLTAQKYRQNEWLDCTNYSIYCSKSELAIGYQTESVTQITN